jgi:hypothetical protein
MTNELICPGSDCDHTEPVSEEDPDASFGEMLDHIRWVHPEMDQRPSVLWPMIEEEE